MAEQTPEQKAAADAAKAAAKQRAADEKEAAKETKAETGLTFPVELQKGEARATVTNPADYHQRVWNGWKPAEPPAQG